MTLGSRSHKICQEVSTPLDLFSYLLQFRRRCNKKIHYLTFDLGVKATRKAAKYPLHHVTYSGTKFEVASFNQEMHLQEIHNLTLGSRSHKMLPSTLYIIRYKV